MCDYLMYYHSPLIKLTSYNICAASVHSGGTQSVMNGETSVCNTSAQGTESFLDRYFMLSLFQNAKLLLCM